jgi:hypothetical protein
MLHRTIPALRGTLAAVAVALVVAACATGAGSPYGAADGAVAAGGDAGTATIGFASPSDGAAVSIPFDVTLTSSVALGEPETGNHHAHLYFDTEPGGADYDIVYGGSWQVTRPLSPGEHTITVALANPDHSLAGPTDQIQVAVGDGDAGSGGGEAPAGAPSAPTVPGY